jgi:uncharacterized membrane protein YkoI
MPNRLRTLSSFAIAALVAVPLHAPAGHGHDLEACLKAVSAVKSGSFVKAEMLSVVEGGEPTYEIEVRDKTGVEWEFMCAADDAHIYEIEREAKSADDAAFKSKARISRQAAAATATAMFPGKIEETEYEIESNGDPSYEFDIVDEDGKEFKVEIDAVSGRIIEVSVEAWEIGEEPDERN